MLDEMTKEEAFKPLQRARMWNLSDRHRIFTQTQTKLRNLIEVCELPCLRIPEGESDCVAAL